jgi:hypothetical protein
MDDSVDLGGKYRYIQDYPQAILYHKTPKYEGGGVNIVPPVVQTYRFDDRYIIAKSLEWDYVTNNDKGRQNLYWIVDKTTNGAPVQPVDSLVFYQRLKELEINLSF